MADIAILETRERMLAGILLTGAAYLLFSTQDASIKLLVVGMSVWQIMFFRSIAILGACAAIGGRQLFADTMRSPIVRPMLVRSAFTLAAWLCYYNAAHAPRMAMLRKNMICQTLMPTTNSLI
ncbi:EamA/RhaT family transporter, partial [Mesorhizobium sp. M7A.F.Ca.ET.027.02.1.1]